MPIQKKILPLLALLILTESNAVAAWWNDAAKKVESAATGAAKGALQQYGGTEGVSNAGLGALGSGVNSLQSSDGNWGDALKSTGDGIQQNLQGAQQQTQLKGQAESKMGAFNKLSEVTDNQKQAVLALYNKAQYQDCIKIMDQTTDIYTMLSKTPDSVKTQNSNMLQKMGAAFSAVNEGDILEVTGKVHSYVITIAPAGSGNTATPASMSKEDLEKIFMEFMQKNYGTMISWVQLQMKNQNTQSGNNSFSGGNTNTNANPFLS